MDQSSSAKIAELEAAVASLRGQITRQATAANALAALSDARAMKFTKCILLDILPPEVRNELYKQLLVSKNPVSFQKVKGHKCIGFPCPRCPDENSVHGLFPVILRVSKQIYREASAVLYGQNTFNAVFTISRRSLDGYAEPPRTLFEKRVALLRYQGLRSDWVHFEKSGTLRRDSFLRQIKHWNFIVEASGGGFSSADLFSFCQILRDVPLLTLKVLVNYSPNPSIPGLFPEVVDPSSLRRALLPLKLLPYVPKSEVFRVEVKDLSQVLQAGFNPNGLAIPRPPREFRIEFRAVKKELEKFLGNEGNTSGLAIYNIYCRLLAYAQAFERSETFKMEMDSEYGYVRQRVNDVLSDFPEVSDIPNEDEHHRGLRLLETRGRSYEYDYPRAPLSPFKSTNYHPVERALEHASYAWEVDHLELLSDARDKIIHYLEPQYRRITAASLVCNNFVKHKKRNLLLFDKMEHEQAWNQLAEFLLQAQKYARSFARDAPDEIQACILCNQSNFNYEYSRCKREQLLKEMSEIIETRGLIDRYIEAFKELVDDMDSQYLQIRKARLGLFDFDIDGMPACDIDLEKVRCDEMVDWRIQEPQITAVIEADAELYWGASGVYQQDPSLSRPHAIEKARHAQYFLRAAAALNGASVFGAPHQHGLLGAAINMPAGLNQLVTQFMQTMPNLSHLIGANQFSNPPGGAAGMTGLIGPMLVSMSTPAPAPATGPVPGPPNPTNAVAPNLQAIVNFNQAASFGVASSFGAAPTQQAPATVGVPSATNANPPQVGAPALPSLIGSALEYTDSEDDEKECEEDDEWEDEDGGDGEDGSDIDEALQDLIVPQLLPSEQFDTENNFHEREGR